MAYGRRRVPVLWFPIVITDQRCKGS
jgi:hypothetical protein